MSTYMTSAGIRRIIKKPISRKEGLRRLKMAYAMMGGIPVERVYLDNFTSRLRRTGAVGDPRKCNNVVRSDWSDPDVQQDELIHTCSSVACLGGWAAVYPPFMKLGLFLHKGDPAVIVAYEKEPIQVLTAWDALAIFFGMESTAQATSVFSFHSDTEYTTSLNYRSNAYSGKRVALTRLREYLLSQGAITPKRNKELIEFEKQF